jgi:ubiquinone/menaquinone biosynthesis C-methylase UbiE
MSTYVYMRFLEAAPYRYDRGIRWLSWGRVTELYRRTAAAAAGGHHAPNVLEIGCGTGNLSAALVARGAQVTAVDCNPDMLTIAQTKLAGKHAVFHEMAAVEIGDRFPAASFDVVAASLVLSEMSDDEQRYVLRAAHKVLRPGGRLVIADEVRPEKRLQRWLYRCARWPVAVLTYLITQTTTSALANPGMLLTGAGFRVVSEDRSGLGSMSVLVAEKVEPSGSAQPREVHHGAG